MRISTTNPAADALGGKGSSIENPPEEVEPLGAHLGGNGRNCSQCGS